MRRMLCSFAAVVLMFAAPASAYAQQVQVDPDSVMQTPSDPAGAIRHARERVAAGDLEGAIIGLQAYVAAHPGEIGPARLLGDLYYRKTETARAEQTYRRILSYAPNDKETHNRLGSVLATEGRIDEAIAEFNRSLPGTDSIANLVELHELRGDLRQYKLQLEGNAEDYPSSAEAQLELGEAYEYLGQADIAEKYFRRALDIQPDSLLGMNYLGLALTDERRYAPAIKEFNACLAHDPLNYACMENLGAAYLHMNDLPRASVALQRAHQLQPERAEAIIDLGYLADERGNWKQAIGLYVDAMTVYPYAPEAYIDLGSLYSSHGLYQLAESALIKGLAIAPKDGRLHFLLGEVYSELGQIAQAAVEYRAAAVSENLDPGYRRAAKEFVAALHTPKPVPTTASTPR